METINSKKYQPNGTKEDIELGILHDVNVLIRYENQGLEALLTAEEHGKYMKK